MKSLGLRYIEFLLYIRVNKFNLYVIPEIKISSQKIPPQPGFTFDSSIRNPDLLIRIEIRIVLRSGSYFQLY